MGLRALLERSASAVLPQRQPSSGTAALHQRPPRSPPHPSSSETHRNTSSRRLGRSHSATDDPRHSDTDSDDDSQSSSASSSGETETTETAVTATSSSTMATATNPPAGPPSAAPPPASTARFKPANLIASKAARLSASARATAAARISRLVGENPPMGSSARVVRRQYQSIVKEREKDYSDEDKEKIDAISLYEVEFPKQQHNGNSTTASSSENYPLGIELETDFYGKHTVVKQVKRGSVAYALSKSSRGSSSGSNGGSFLKPGHVVVAVNGKDLSQLSFLCVLAELRVASSPRVIRFLDPSVLPITEYKHGASLVNRDQYGFAKDDKYILNYRRQLRKRTLASYAHERRWAEFVQHQGGMDTIDRLLHDETMDPYIHLQRSAVLAELRTLVLQGIPAVLRPRVWSTLTGVTSYRRKYPHNYYAQLVSQIDSSPSIGDIEKDIHRTYPEHVFFQSPQGRQELKNVLGAFSLHRLDIGYCQSMNFIAGMLVLFMNEEDAFWVFCAIMDQPQYLPAQNYTQSMVGTQTDQLVFKQLVTQELPDVAARLELCGIQIQLITLHWFLCAFVCTLPTEAALRVWDWFFVDGQEVLFITAIGILKQAESQILSATTHSDLHTIVRELGTDLHDDDAFLAFLYQIAPPNGVGQRAVGAAMSSTDETGWDSDEDEDGSSNSEEEEEEEEDEEEDHPLDEETADKDKPLETKQPPPVAFATSAAHSSSPRKRRRRMPTTKIHTMLQQFLDSQRKVSKQKSTTMKTTKTTKKTTASDPFQKQFSMLEISDLRDQFRPQFEKSKPETRHF